MRARRRRSSEPRTAGSGTVVWLDALDLPVVYLLEAFYCLDGKPQTVHNQPDASQTRYRRSGLLPYTVINGPRNAYSLRRFPWKETRAALGDMAGVTDASEIVLLAYVNLGTGLECLRIPRFSAIMLRPGETIRPVRHSASAVLHVVDGEGEAQLDGAMLRWSNQDTVAVATHSGIEIVNRSTAAPAILFQVDEAPMQRKLRLYEESDRL